MKRIKTVYFSKPNVLFEESLIEIRNDDNIRELMALCERHPHIDLFVEHTDTYDEQYDVEDAEHKGGFLSYFPEDEFDDSNISNKDKGLDRVRKDKKSQNEELNRDLMLGNAQTERVMQGEETREIIRILIMLRALGI